MSLDAKARKYAEVPFPNLRKFRAQNTLIIGSLAMFHAVFFPSGTWAAAYRPSFTKPREGSKPNTSVPDG
jgi:hypothetical protein